MRLIFFLVLLAGLIQAASFEFIKLFGVKPDILLVIVVFAALSFSREQVIRCAIIAGLVKDISSASILGSYTLSFVLAGFLIYLHQNKFYRENALTQAVLSFSAYICVGLCAVFLNSIAYRDTGFAYNSIGPIIGGAIYTCLAAPVIFLVSAKLLRVKLGRVF